MIFRGGMKQVGWVASECWRSEIAACDIIVGGVIRGRNSGGALDKI